MQTDEGKPTLFAKLVEWQTLLAAGSKTAFTHVDLFREAAVLQWTNL
jgi:hypothetical protein